MLIGLLLPIDLLSRSRIPAASATARTEPPAMTPVPCEAGRSMTVLAPKSRVTACGMVAPTRGTLTRFFLASSTPLRIDSGTSPALPRPTPTIPLPSPTTTTELKLKRRPPLTTLATRLIWTTFSSRLSFVGSMRAMIPPLQVEAALAGALGERANPPVIPISATVQDHGADPGRLRALRERAPDGAGRLHLSRCDGQAGLT